MKKIKFYMLCGNSEEQYIQIADGYEIEIAERKVGLAKNMWGAWTATDIETGLAYPLSEFFEKRSDLVEWLHLKEPEFKKAFKKAMRKDNEKSLKWAAIKLAELKGEI